MKIKINNSILLNKAFLPSIERLLQSRSMPAKTCIEINTAIDEISSHVDILRRARRDTVLRNCSKDKDGKAIVGPDGNVVFPDHEAEAKCRKELADLENEYLTIELTTPVTIYEDENITPLDLRLLGGMVEVKERPKIQES